MEAMAEQLQQGGEFSAQAAAIEGKTLRPHLEIEGDVGPCQGLGQLLLAELADPAFGAISGEKLVSMTAPESTAPGARNASGDTVGLTAVSDDGWAVSLINSVYWGFGAHILEPDTGIIFQNRGTSFSLDPASPNAFAPGKRPRHTLMPVMILRGDELILVPATMGGSAQPQIHAQLLLRQLGGATPSEATYAPRWIVNEAREDGVRSVTTEEDVPQLTKEALEAAGFVLQTLPKHSEKLGHSNVIRIDPGGYSAASDPRSDGCAIVT